MSYILKEDILKKCHSKRPGGNYKKTSITIHSTGNVNSTAMNERAWLDNPTNKRDASWHYVVGEGIVIQAIPENEEAWHSGTTEGNRYSIGVEFIESGDREKVLETAAEFVSDLLKKYGWNVDKLKKHYDWTGKDCPRILINSAYVKGGMNWNWFVNKVKEYMEGEMIEESKIIVDGKEVPVRRILKDGTNYIAIRDVADAVGYSVGNNGNIAVLTKK